ncbi:hypothetical protein Ahia01_000216800, partial [Argonauta hians]
KLFHFLWEGRSPMVRRPICCQPPLAGGLGMPWVLYRKHAMRLRHLHLYLQGPKVWSPFVRRTFPELVSLTEVQSWIKRRPRLGVWHTECRQALTSLAAICRTGNALSGSSTSFFYRELVQIGNNDVLGETLTVDDDQLAGLFRRTFGPGPMDNFQRSLAWQCYRGALPVRDKLFRHGYQRYGQLCPRCDRENETVQHALITCPGVRDVWVYAEQLLSRMGAAALSTESIVKIDPPSHLCEEGRAVFVALVAVAKMIVWWTRLRGLKSGFFLFGD